jgi:hypothetical protein
VRAIEIEIELERLIPSSARTLNTTLVRRIFLPNREQT